MPYLAKHHVRAYYCQNCFKHLVKWVRQQYPTFMKKGEVNTSYYATLIGLKSEAMHEREMDEKVFGFTSSHETDTPFTMTDVADLAPLSAFVPHNAEELDAMMTESRKLMLNE